MNMGIFSTALRKLILLSGFISILFSGISMAATHYVSPSGNHSWVESINIDTPCSVSTAMSNASAGDAVYFRGGTYNTGESSYQNPVYEPSNSGTSGNPITFVASSCSKYSNPSLKWISLLLPKSIPFPSNLKPSCPAKKNPV